MDGRGFEVSKAQPSPVGSLCLHLADKDVVSQLRVQHHTCLPAARLPTMMIMLPINSSLSGLGCVVSCHSNKN